MHLAFTSKRVATLIVLCKHTKLLMSELKPLMHFNCSNIWS